MGASALITLTIIEMVLKHGPQAVLAIAAAWETDAPTPEQIRGLFIDKDPEEYFK